MAAPLHPYRRDEMAGDTERARLRTEFEQLQREFRNMEATRKAYAEESLGAIKKQKELIEKLSRDNDAVKGELETELRFLSRKPQNEANASSLHDQLDLYIGKVEIEHRNIESLTKQLEILRAKVVKETKVIGGVNAAKEAEKSLDKKARVLDNRLEKALVRFNEALATNKELRNQIDTLRQERGVFEAVYRKLERELADKKKAMAALIESSNQAYEARDVAQMEVAKIQQETNAERIVFEKQLAAMDAAVDSEVDLARQEEFDMRGTLTMEEEERLKRDLKDGRKELAASAHAVRVFGARVDAYEVAFTRIRDETGIDEVEELVSVFLKNEDANFALFNYVGEQTSELQRLEEVMALLRKEAMGFEAGRKLLELQGEGGGVPGAPPRTARSSGRSGAASPKSSRSGARPGGAGAASSPGGAVHAVNDPPQAEGAAAAAGAAGASVAAAPPSLPSPNFSPQQNEELLALQAQLERTEKRQAETRRLLDGCRAQLQSTITATGADRLPGAALALTDGAVTEGTLLQALGLVEQRATALLAGYAALTRAAEQEANEARASRMGMAGGAGRAPSPGGGGGAGGGEEADDASELLRLARIMGRAGGGGGGGQSESPERRTAMSFAGHGPASKTGATNDRLHPSALPAVSDFAARDADGEAGRLLEGGGAGGAGANGGGGDGDDDDDDEGGGASARPLTLASIRDSMRVNLAWQPQ